MMDRWNWKAAIIALVTCAVPAPLLAMEKLDTRDAFLSTMDGRDLTIRLYGLRLDVDPAGVIQGRAAGRSVTGEWTWQDGYFCRSMLWGKREIPYNCQLVEVDGNTMRFTTDQGAGDYADFVLRD